MDVTRSSIDGKTDGEKSAGHDLPTVEAYPNKSSLEIGLDQKIKAKRSEIGILSLALMLFSLLSFVDAFGPNQELQSHNRKLVVT